MIMTGKYAVTVGADGDIFVPVPLSRHYKDGENYYVLINEDGSRGTYLSYRFNEEIGSEEKLIKIYKVPEDKHLKVPSQYREAMTGKCYLLGVGYGIELHKAEIFDREEDIAFEDLEKRMKELGL